MEKGKLEFSLILATLGRTSELDRFLQHLVRQSYRDFELVIVDQNPLGFLDSIWRPYADALRIRCLRSHPGLSRARNVGLQCAVGDLIAFPDDDCWYPPDLLQNVVDVFNRSPNLGGVVGYCMDPAGKPFFNLDVRPGRINKFNVWRRATSATIFLQRRLIERVGLFDEGLGVGSGTPNLAAEDVDYMIRAVKSGAELAYIPSLSIFHPVPSTDYGPPMIRRGYGYGRGHGVVLRRHHYPVTYVAYVLFRALGGAVVAFLTGNFAKARYHHAVLRGRLLGWLV